MRIRMTSLVGRSFALFFLTSLSFAENPISYQPYRSGDLVYAPPPFAVGNGKAVPADILSTEVTYRFNLSAKSGRVTARVLFRNSEWGYPTIDLVPQPTAVRLDGIFLNPNRFPRVATPPEVVSASFPYGVTEIPPVRVLQIPLGPLAVHVLDLAYDVPAADFSITGKAVRMLFHMIDVNVFGRVHFWESYAPANLEFDRFRTTVRLIVEGDASDQLIFANGTVRADWTGPRASQWTIRFPENFTSSSYYLHFADRQEVRRQEEFTYHGLTRDIPVTFYTNIERSDRYWERSKQLMADAFAEMENTYGPYPHRTFIAYFPFDTQGIGGMEYAGATFTNQASLSHEISHQWFARGVMPSEGRSGWIDEAFAAWRDSGYEPLNPFGFVYPYSSYPVGIGSPYRRDTNLNAYYDGMQLLQIIADRAGSPETLKGYFRDLFLAKQGTVLEQHEFQRFLERGMKRSLSSPFDGYVFIGPAVQQNLEMMVSPFAASRRNRREVPERIPHHGFSSAQLSSMR